MKRTKKLAALFLAMVMAFSLMAVAAAAYGAEEHEHTGACSTETIQPRKPGATCLYCGAGMTEGGTVWVNNTRCIRFKCYNDECPYFIREGKRATQDVPW